MSPDQITTFTAVISLMAQLGVDSIAVWFASLYLLPWVILVFVSIAQHRRFESVVKMYENNFCQTDNVVSLTEGYRNMTKGYEELVKWTISEVSESKNVALNNMHCPIVRKNARPKDYPHE